MFAAWALFSTMALVLAEIHFEKVDHLYGKHLIVATADVKYPLFDLNLKKNLINYSLLSSIHTCMFITMITVPLSALTESSMR